MNRREFTKAVASIPIATSVVPSVSAEEVEEVEDNTEWNVRGVWRRRDETGLLDVRDEDTEVEFQEYNEWVSTTLRSLSESSDIAGVVNLFDFRLISVYSGEYARSHFSHPCGMEVTIKREPDEEVEYTAYVTHVEEKWDEHRESASSSQIRLAQKLKRERDEYL